MASKKCSLIWVILFLCMLGLSVKAIARNIVGATEMYAVSDEIMGQNRKLLSPDQRCKRGKIHYNLHDVMTDRKASNNPRCHHYL
ncbi:hypothetical protein MtrunA17_Chr8g0368881 [Medicago truncatula]|uniref:RALF-like protein n=1 Tax=Medicago truncatula TaxID=3880 RepID=A0A072TTQ9_MEDTR|nr:RALF-like protein [Medicago truncatula]RHN41704.1 hypothetical protein MtrunA17_Chr8g0368881 [Medicago truncatula]